MEYLSSRHVFAMATCEADQPYCAFCFYALDFPDFVFATDPATRHGREMQLSGQAAVGVFDATTDPAAIRGVQLTGSVASLAPDDGLREVYFRRFAYAESMKPTLWTFRAAWLKMTDNTVHFGYKRIWQAPS